MQQLLFTKKQKGTFKIKFISFTLFVAKYDLKDSVSSSCLIKQNRNFSEKGFLERIYVKI